MGGGGVAVAVADADADELALAVADAVATGATTVSGIVTFAYVTSEDLPIALVA